MILNTPLSLSHESLLLGLAAFGAYGLILGISRLIFHPLARFPGPKLAAFSFWYECYYDCILGGQYSAKIKQLHKQYRSSIIRISPNEVHILDPDFCSELYAGAGRKRDIDAWFADAFGAPGSHFSTLTHNLHRERRAVMTPLFSPSSVRKLQPVMEERIDKLLARIRGFRDDGEILDLTMAFPAVTNDIISAFSFGTSDHFTERLDWGIEMTNALKVGTVKGSTIMKHFPMLRQTIEVIPENIVVKLMPAYGIFAAFKHKLARQIEAIQEQRDPSQSPQSIFHDILNSKLPPHEKSAARLGSEGRILIQAGTLTASWALAVTLYYLLSQPATLRTLRQELFAAIADPSDAIALSTLEKLPYLTACVKESLRLSIGASGRLPRIPTDEILVLRDRQHGNKEWRIPMGTKCSMTMEHILTDADIYPSPMSYRPERWIEDTKKELERYFVPFAKGSRMCLGMHLATAEIYLVLARLLRRFGGPGSEEGEGVLRLWETGPRDVVMEGDFFIPMPWAESKGVRVTVDRA